MEPRTRLALGGAAVFAVSVSVVASVVATSTVALADAPGVGIGAHSVRLPSATPVVPAVGETDVVPEVQASTAPVAETLPAPAPAPVIAPSQAVAAPPVDVEAEILATGSWQPVREWSSTQGWSSDDVDAWITRFRSTHQLTQDGTVVSPDSDQKTTQTPVPTGPSDSQATTPGNGSKKDRSPGTPDLSD